MGCVVGCDIGTTSTKSVAIDVETGAILAAASSFEYLPVSPAPIRAYMNVYLVREKKVRTKDA